MKHIQTILFFFCFLSQAFGSVPLGINKWTDKEQQIVRVCKSGCVYSTIQGAIDSITDAASDKAYTVLVYPGEYSENITGKNYVNLAGAGEQNTVVVTGSSGTLYTAPSIASFIGNCDSVPATNLLICNHNTTHAGAYSFDFNEIII